MRLKFRYYGANDFSQDKNRAAMDLYSQPAIVVARCLKCKADLGRLVNSWFQITGSYYLPEHRESTTFERLKQSPLDRPTLMNSSNKKLEGCLNHPLRCTVCDEPVAFRCIDAPAQKASFRNREFLKLSKIILVTPTHGETVQPEVKDGPVEPVASPVVDADKMAHPSPRPQSSSGSGVSARAPGNLEVERETVEIYKKTLSWQAAHEHFEARTKRDLSPNAFGEYLLQYLPKELDGQGLLDKIDRQQPAATTRTPTSDSFPPRAPGFQAMNGGVAMHNPPPPQQPIQPRQSPQNSYQTKPNTPQQNSTRTDSAMGQHTTDLQAQRRDLDRVDFAVGRLQVEMHHLRVEVNNLRGLIEARPNGATGVAHDADASTVDVLSDTVTNLSNKVGEIDGLKITIENLKRKVRKLEESAGQPTTPSQMYQHSPHGTHPAPPSSHPPAYAHHAGTKRKYEEPESKERSGNGQYNWQSQPPLIQPAQPVRFVPSQKEGAMATFQSEHERPGLKHESGAPRVGRPRKSSTELGTPVWEKESWTGSDIDHDGYYRFGTVQTGPSSADRGRIVRRGSGGSLYEKKTRTRPIRNADGVLIRKDGKPDQRSISSPQNLKKTHARKQMELDVMRGGGSSLSREAMSAGDGEQDLDESATPTPSDERGQSEHEKIMKQMFPRGVKDEEKRMSHASRLLSSEDEEGGGARAEAIPRRDMIRAEVEERAAELVAESVEAANGHKHTYAPHSTSATESPVVKGSTDEPRARADPEVSYVASTPVSSAAPVNAEAPPPANAIPETQVTKEPEPEPERQDHDMSDAPPVADQASGSVYQPTQSQAIAESV